ncbi:hypothetical protein K1719_008284 [Acacia pycnantha]|nr:hypothetical protein K1719_008284 [Acacia pycnantha]
MNKLRDLRKYQRSTTKRSGTQKDANEAQVCASSEKNKSDDAEEEKKKKKKKKTNYVVSSQFASPQSFDFDKISSGTNCFVAEL